MLRLGFLSGSVIKNLPANIGTAGDLGSIPGLVQYPGRDWNGNPLQYSCLENPMGRGGFRATVHRVAKSQTWLSDWPRVQAHLRYVGCCLLSWWMSWSPEWNSALMTQLYDWAGGCSLPVFIKLWSVPMPVREMEDPAWELQDNSAFGRLKKVLDTEV